MNKPSIQVDDEVREMTDEEFAQYEAAINYDPALPSAE
jgi:hypothetical protein